MKLWLRQPNVWTILRRHASMPGTKLTQANVCAFNMTCSMWPGTLQGYGYHVCDRAGMSANYLKFGWAKIWMPINSSWITEYYSPEIIDVTTSFQDNEEPYLLSCAVYQTLCPRFYQHNFTGFSKHPQWVAIDIHILKMREQRLKEVESCPNIIWLIRAEMKISISTCISQVCAFSFYMLLSQCTNR